MKKLILFFLFITSFYINASSCKKSTLFHTRCELVENGKTFELVTMKKACSATEADPSVDCFYVKTCEKNDEDTKSSMVVHNTKAHLDSLCDDSKKGRSFFFATHEDKKSFKASILCNDQKRPLAIELESPKGLKKSCPVFFFK